MALSPDFATTQTYGYPSRINFQDTSTGSDGAISARRIYLQDKAGNYIVEEGTTTNYEVWPYADSTITLDVLLKDYALNVRVDWVNSGGTVLYTKTVLTLYALYVITFYINLTKYMSANRKLKDNANFYFNFIKLLCSIKQAQDAVLLMDDISSAQAALTRAKNLIDNQPNFY